MRPHEHERRPVVHLAHHQPGAHLERDAAGPSRTPARPSGPAAARTARVRRGRWRGDVEERQEDARQDQQHEAVEGDLAEQERPVAGEHLAQVPLQERGAVEPLVDPLDQLAQDHGSLPEARAHRRREVARGPQDAVGPDLDRQLGERLGRRAVDGLRRRPGRRRWTGGRGSAAGARPPGRGRAGTRRGCRSSSTRPTLRGLPPAAPGGSWSSPGPTRISTACESAEPTEPSGKTVVKESVSSVSRVHRRSPSR